MMTSNMHVSNNCCLCEEISSRTFPGQYRSAYPIDSRICHETDEFVVLPTVSPLCAGHVLILPRQHVSNLATLPEPARRALLACANSTVSVLAEHFGSDLYFFEHGVAEAGLACGIDHAHLHILPLSAATADAVELHIETDFPAHSADSLVQSLSSSTQVKTTSYLLHGASLNSMRMSFSESIPSQYMRRLIADIQRRPEWDWKLLDGRPELFATCAAFTGAKSLV
jgi:diadenosine tetraphosphate (Ap4A) HIT family hydrolase